MTTKRLSSLAMTNILGGGNIYCKPALKIFLKLQPRKLKVSNLIFDEKIANSIS